MFKSIRNPLYNNQIFLSNLNQISTDKNGDNNNTENSVSLDNNNFNLNFSNSRFIRKNNNTSSALPQNTQTIQNEEESHFLPHPDPMLQHDRSIVIKSSALEVDSLDGLGVYKKNPFTNEWTYSKHSNSNNSIDGFGYSKRNGYTNDIQTYKETKCTVINKAPSYINLYDPLYIYNSSKNSDHFIKYGQIIEDF